MRPTAKKRSTRARDIREFREWPIQSNNENKRRLKTDIAYLFALVDEYQYKHNGPVWFCGRLRLKLTRIDNALKAIADKKRMIAKYGLDAVADAALERATRNRQLIMRVFGTEKAADA